MPAGCVSSKTNRKSAKQRDAEVTVSVLLLLRTSTKGKKVTFLQNATSRRLEIIYGLAEGGGALVYLRLRQQIMNAGRCVTLILTDTAERIWEDFCCWCNPYYHYAGSHTAAQEGKRRL